MMKTMKTPATRAEFEHRFHLLRERLQHGRMSFANSHMTIGLQKIRYLPNGRIDFLSVNESARLQANMMLQFQGEAFEEIIKNQGDQEAPKDGAPEDTVEVPIK
jgi:hypothetical protein